MKKSIISAFAMLLALLAVPVFGQDATTTDTESEMTPIAERPWVWQLGVTVEDIHRWGGTIGISIRNEDAFVLFMNPYVELVSTYGANIGGGVGFNTKWRDRSGEPIEWFSTKIGVLYQWENNFLISDGYKVSESFDGPNLMMIGLQAGPHFEFLGRFGCYFVYIHQIAWDPKDSSFETLWRLKLKAGIFVNFGGKRF